MEWKLNILQMFFLSIFGYVVGIYIANSTLNDLVRLTVLRGTGP